jgi:hypothetical protein
MGGMTQRERRLVIATFGWVEFLICVIMVADSLINGRVYPALTILLALTVTASGPFVVPAMWQEWKDSRLYGKKPDEPGKAGGST